MNPASRPYPWKTFAFLSAAGTLTGPLVLPYFFGLQATAPNPQPVPLSPGMLVLAALWGANLATALFFGWYHISNEQLFAATVPAIVGLRTVLIILPVGLAFGWLYMRRGLEAAILSHFVIDVIVHVVRPIVEHGLARG